MIPAGHEECVMDPDPTLAHPRIPPAGELHSWEQS